MELFVNGEVAARLVPHTPGIFARMAGRDWRLWWMPDSGGWALVEWVEPVAPAEQIAPSEPELPFDTEQSPSDARPLAP